MNKTTEALKLAEGALLRSNGALGEYTADTWRLTMQDNDEALAAIREVLAEQEKQEPVAWCDHVEHRLLTWRQSFVNRSGDQLALDDFMDQRSLEDLIDFVCDEYTAPTPRKPEPVEQEPVVRARIAPPAPPEVYQMRSKDAYEAGWWEAQREKAVSPIAPVSAKAIRAEALEEAAEWCEAKQSYNAMHANTEFAAGIRGLK